MPTGDEAKVSAGQGNNYFIWSFRHAGKVKQESLECPVQFAGQYSAVQEDVWIMCDSR